MQPLSKSAQKIQDILTAHGAEFNVIELPASTRTAVEAAHAIGCKVEQIVKSLIFKGKSSGQPILVLASGPTRVNEKKIEAELGEPLEKADADFTRQVTGFAIGGIPPIGHAQKIITFIDQDLLNYEEVWAAAGTPHAVFKLRSHDLEKLTGGKLISIV